VPQSDTSEYVTLKQCALFTLEVHQEFPLMSLSTMCAAEKQVNM